MAKKRKGKYPNLNPSQNTLSRQDYIETDYVDGVFDEKGNELIRPLTKEEKEWLNKFYGEYVAFSDRQLNPTPEIMEYMEKKSEFKKKIAKIRRETGKTENEQIRFYQRKIDEIEAALDFLRTAEGVFHPTCQEQRDLYSINNSRNFCVYNNRKARGMLLELTTETYDSFVATFWDILATFNYDSQDALIDIVEERLREQGFLGEELPAEDFAETSPYTYNKRNKA